MRFILPMVSLVTLLTFGSGCKKSDSSSPAAPTTIASGAGSCDNDNLALLLAPSLPAVYAPLLITTKPELSEVSYTYGTPAAVYKSLLIQFSNTPVVGREQETTADYGKYKICGPDGKCLQTCVAGVCSEEATTATFLEEVPIPDSLVTGGKGVFTVYTASCVSASRRKAQDTSDSPVAASNPECGAWSENVVLHSQNADAKLEAMFTEFRNVSLDRQSLAGDLATAARQFLASQPLALADSTIAPTASNSLVIAAQNLLKQQHKFEGLLKEGELAAVQDSIQQGNTPAALALAGCATPDSNPNSEPPTTVTLNNTIVNTVTTTTTTAGAVVTQNVTIVDTATRTDAGITINTFSWLNYTDSATNKKCVQIGGSSVAIVGDTCDGASLKQAWTFIPVSDPTRNNLYQMQSASTPTTPKCWAYVAGAKSVILGACSTSAAMESVQLFVAQAGTAAGTYIFQPSTDLTKCVAVDTTGFTVVGSSPKTGCMDFTVTTGGPSAEQVEAVADSASRERTKEIAKGSAMIVSGLIVGVIGVYTMIRNSSYSFGVRTLENSKYRLKPKIVNTQSWGNKVLAKGVGPLFVLAGIALAVIGILFDNQNMGLAGTTTDSQLAWQQAIQDSGEAYTASVAKTDAILDSIDAYLGPASK